MTRQRRSFRMPRPAALAALVGLTAVAVLGIAGPAQAHNYLISSTPTANTTISELPARFEVTTNGVLLNIDKSNDGFALQIQDAAGLYYGDGCVDVDGPSISAKAAIGKPGAYVITWQVISTDGHSVSDTLPFTWAGPADGSTTGETAGQKAVPDCHGTVETSASGSTKTTSRAPVTGQVLNTVLWIGGTVIVVGLAVLVTILLAGRRRKA